MLDSDMVPPYIRISCDGETWRIYDDVGPLYSRKLFSEVVRIFEAAAMLRKGKA